MSMRYSIPCPSCGKDQWRFGLLFDGRGVVNPAFTFSCDGCEHRTSFQLEYSLAHDLVKASFKTWLPRVPTVRSRPGSWGKWRNSENQKCTVTRAINDYVPRYYCLEEQPGQGRNFAEYPTIRPLLKAALDSSGDTVIGRIAYERSVIALGQDLAP